MVVSKTVIIANLTQAQLEYLQNLANQHDISIEVIVEGVATSTVEEVEETPTSTPITAEMLGEIAIMLNKTVLEVAALAASLGIETVEDALASSDIPSSVKEVLESYL